MRKPNKILAKVEQLKLANELEFTVFELKGPVPKHCVERLFAAIER